MRRLVFIGNGFDLRHGQKTRYTDFINYYDNKSMQNNVLFHYFKNMKECIGWSDFERDLLLFLESVTKMRNSISLTQYNEYYIIKNTDIVHSPETRIFFDTILEMKYPFFRLSKYDILIDIENKDWHKLLVDIILSDYDELKNHLNIYLLEMVNKNAEEIPMMNDSSIDCIKSADIVFTFNYTNLITKYKPNNLYYVHGDLDNNIILGVPYSEKITLAEFNRLFKISQSIFYEKNIGLLNFSDEVLHLYFIGFSFSKSDHYFFQEIREVFDTHNWTSEQGIPQIYFHYFYHNEESKLDFLYNLRIFLGEKLLVTLDLHKQIHFEKY